jgi:hypothetical protein
MSRRHRTMAGAVATVVGLGVVGFAGPSAAHHPELEARALCVAGNLARVVVDTYSWEVSDPIRKTNPDIVVTMGGQTRRGAFNAANDYRFQVSFDVPADGRTYVVRSNPAAPWGLNGEWGSVNDYRETTVTVPQSCPAAGSGTSVSTTTVPGGGSSTTTPTTPAPAGPTTTAPDPSTGGDEGDAYGQVATPGPSNSGGSSTAVVVPVPDGATKVPVGLGLDRSGLDGRGPDISGLDGGGLVAGLTTSSIEVRIIATSETRPPAVEVQGAVQFQQLPHTGTDPKPFIALGIVLAAIGVLLDSLARRHSPVDVVD